MIRRLTLAPGLIPGFILFMLTLCLPFWTAAAETNPTVFMLSQQALDNLRQEGVANNILVKLEVIKYQWFDSTDEFLKAVRQEIGKKQTVRLSKKLLKHAAINMEDEFQYITEALNAQKQTINGLRVQNRELENRLAAFEAMKGIEQQNQYQTDDQEEKTLEQRVKALEDSEIGREDATRFIIRDAISTMGSKINEFVTLGGNLEVLFGSAQVFDGPSERVLQLNTTQLDFEAQVNDWTLGSFIIEYDPGRDRLFSTSEGTEKAVDRITIDTASITIGDIQRFPPFLTAGRIIVPFGISTGNPVHDVPTIEDPLTIEAFETRQEAFLLGFGAPTPVMKPATPPITPPPVRPLVLNPLFRSISRALGYKPPPKPPPQPTPVIPTPPPPPFTGGLYFFNGETSARKDQPSDWRIGENLGATVGYSTKGSCGRPYDQLQGRPFCPWSVDIDVDFISSVFDSRFLEVEYDAFLNQIGFVSGMAASVKGSLGPVGLIFEWNGAIEDAEFIDDQGSAVIIRPNAWHVSLTYQFDWNPWVEAIAAQGNYLAIGYSQSDDLAGVLDASENRVGNVAERRMIASVGEWVFDGLRVALEYSHNWDYGEDEGGTGGTAHGIFLALTYEW